MILVDTSVLISYLKGDDNPAVEKMNRIFERKMMFGICPHVYLEVLQGAATEKDFDELQEYLGSQVFYTLLDEVASYAKAARMYFELRRRGMTVSSTVDCLIAQTAIENGLFLLHNDADFDKIARLFPLKVWD